MSIFISMPKKYHLVDAKRILRYFIGTLKLGLDFPTSMREKRTYLIGYSDGDQCGDIIGYKKDTWLCIRIQ